MNNRTHDPLTFIKVRMTGLVSKAKVSILERRKAIEADIADRRARQLEADRMVLQVPAQAEKIKAMRASILASPTGSFLDRNSVMDTGATATIGRKRRIIKALDELLADVPAAVEYWKQRSKELAS